MKTLALIADTIHQNVWDRLIGPDGVMYDYAGADGRVILPTPEECRNNMPNGLGWWTPIENGGFFNGMYLIGLCDRYLLNPTSRLKAEIRRLVAGLYRLQDAGSTPGFIARGLGSDGCCHYPASSNDQNFPWLMGLGRFLETDIADGGERLEAIGRLIRHGEALLAADWHIPGDRPGFVRGWYLHGEFTSCVHIAAATQVLYRASGDKKWRTLHYRLLAQVTDRGISRSESIRRGCGEMAHWSAWFLSNCQYAVRRLWQYETDPELKECYRQSLDNTARAALPMLALYRTFAPGSFFTPDWRIILPLWRPQQNQQESENVAMAEFQLWHEACPAMAEEKFKVTPSVCGAWCVVLAADDRLRQEYTDMISGMLGQIDFAGLYYATMFYGENLIATINQLKK